MYAVIQMHFTPAVALSIRGGSHGALSLGCPDQGPAGLSSETCCLDCSAGAGVTLSETRYQSVTTTKPNCGGAAALHLAVNAGTRRHHDCVKQSPGT